MTKYSLSAKNKLWNCFKSLVQQMNITLTRKYSFMPKRGDDKCARTLGSLQYITRIPVNPSNKHPATLSPKLKLSGPMIDINAAIILT